MIRAGDALKYAAVMLKSRADWTCDSIAGSMCTEDHETELDAIDATVREILALAVQFGNPCRCSDGRRVESFAEIQRGHVIHHVWHPDPSAEQPASWRAVLPSDPGEPSPGIYEVTTDAATQGIHVRVVKTV